MNEQQAIKLLQELGYMVVKVPACNRDYDHGRHPLITKTKSCLGKGNIPHGYHSSYSGVFGLIVNCKCGYGFSDYMGDPLTDWEKHNKEYGIDEQTN